MDSAIVHSHHGYFLVRGSLRGTPTSTESTTPISWSSRDMPGTTGVYSYLPVTVRSIRIRSTGTPLALFYKGDNN